MSTADSNLHALSAVTTRDVYHQVRPESSDRERTWFGRIVIVHLPAVVFKHALVKVIGLLLARSATCSGVLPQLRRPVAGGGSGGAGTGRVR